MKKAILIAISMLATQAPLLAHAEGSPVNVLLAGGPEANMIGISLSPDGRNYVIDSIVPLEVGGTVCSNPPEKPNELICQAAAIGSFEVNAGAGDDSVGVAGNVPVPVTLRGGGGPDRLAGGGGGQADRRPGRRPPLCRPRWRRGDHALRRQRRRRSHRRLRRRRAARRGGGPTRSSAARRTDRTGPASVVRRGAAQAAVPALAGRRGQPAADEEQRDHEADQRERGVEPEGRLDAVGERGYLGRRTRSSSAPGRSSRRRSGTCRRCRRPGWSAIRRPR